MFAPHCFSHSHFYLYSPFSADLQELARQNKITKQILEAFIQKKLGLSKGYVKPPSIQEILPVKKPEERHVRQNQSDHQDTQEYAEDDSLQSVESEQIDNIYSEGMYYLWAGLLFLPLSL